MSTSSTCAVFVAAAALLVPPASAEVVVYQHDEFEGRHFTAGIAVPDLTREGLMARASSIVVLGEMWEGCEGERFRGRCIVLRPGRYATPAAMGLDNRIASLRAMNPATRVAEFRLAPAAVPIYDNRRRAYESYYQATVKSVRAVLGTPERPCAAERDDPLPRGAANAPGPLIGSLLGGVLGHQLLGRAGEASAAPHGETWPPCAGDSSTSRPRFWEVTYEFRGQAHRAQMLKHPGASVTVNQRGEPRA